MAEEEKTPEPTQEPESETPEKQDAGAEKPKEETPAKEVKTAEQPAGETPPEQQASFEQPQAAGESPPGKETNKDARMWAMISHLAALAGIVVPAIGCVVGPLVIWQIKKEEFPFVDDQGKEAVNFQISILIYAIVAALLIFACVGIVLLPAVYIFDLIFLLIAAVKANDGEKYRYPLTIRFIK